MSKILDEILNNKGFVKADVDIEGLIVYYSEKNIVSQILCFFDMELHKDWEYKTVDKVLEQISSSFQYLQGKPIHFISFLIGANSKYNERFLNAIKINLEANKETNSEANKKSFYLYESDSMESIYFESLNMENSSYENDDFVTEINKFLQGKNPEDIFKINVLVKREEKKISKNKKNNKLVENKPSDWMNYLRLSSVHIVIINLIIFLVMDIISIFISSDFSNNVIYWGANSGEMVLKYKQYYRLVTSIFLHGDFGHVSGNMMALLILGIFLEEKIGRIRFLFIYFSTGILADLASIGYNVIVRDGMSLGIGASGALFGIFGATLVFMVVHRREYGGEVAKRFLLYTVLSAYAGFSVANIDNAAHIGGFFSGIIVASVVLYVIPTLESEIKNR